jgi:glucose-6-phosphate-specific signal transduction histidine kinase
LPPAFSDYPFTNMLANQQAVADAGVGTGHAPEHYASEGFGLSGMRQRADAIDGEHLIALYA